MKYADLLPIFLKKNLVQSRPPTRVPDVLPDWYRLDCNCAFHQGAPGHDTDQCYPLKEEVQKLIENDTWSFQEPDLKVLSQQQHLTSHSVATMPIMNAIQNPSYQPQFQQNQQPPRQQAPRTYIDPIPMKYVDLFPWLIKRNFIHTKAPLLVPAICEQGIGLNYLVHAIKGHQVMILSIVLHCRR